MTIRSWVIIHSVPQFAVILPSLSSAQSCPGESDDIIAMIDYRKTSDSSQHGCTNKVHIVYCFIQMIGHISIVIIYSNWKCYSLKKVVIVAAWSSWALWKWKSLISVIQYRYRNSPRICRIPRYSFQFCANLIFFSNSGRSLSQLSVKLWIFVLGPLLSILQPLFSKFIIFCSHSCNSNPLVFNEVFQNDFIYWRLMCTTVLYLCKI